MSFVESAIAASGLGDVLELHRRGADMGSYAERLRGADWLVVGALADVIRHDDVGGEVRIYQSKSEGRDVRWFDETLEHSELDVLRWAAVERIVGPRGIRVGFNWERHGLELAQVALGFGVSDLAGRLTRKSGLPIYEDESKRVKGTGLVNLAALKQREIASLVERAGRMPVFVQGQTNLAESAVVHA